MADVHKLSERVIWPSGHPPSLTRLRERGFDEEGYRRAGSCFLRLALVSMRS